MIDMGDQKSVAEQKREDLHTYQRSLYVVMTSLSNNNLTQSRLKREFHALAPNAPAVLAFEQAQLEFEQERAMKRGRED